MESAAAWRQWPLGRVCYSQSPKWGIFRALGATREGGRGSQRKQRQEEGRSEAVNGLDSFRTHCLEYLQGPLGHGDAAIVWYLALGSGLAGLQGPGVLQGTPLLPWKLLPHPPREVSHQSARSRYQSNRNTDEV